MAQNITDNVTDLMIGRLRQLPRETQNVLNLAACIGNQFNLDTLSVISEKSSTALLQLLTVAVESGYLLPLAESRSRRETKVAGGKKAQREFKFLHDHVQKAAYALVEPESRKEVHVMIGRLMLKSFSAAEVDENIFQVVKQLNKGQEFLSDEESVCLAKMNLLAGRKAKGSVAYLQAWNNFKTGISLLPEKCWQLDYHLAFDLFKECYECEYIRTNFDEASSLFEIIINHIDNLSDKVAIYSIGIQQNTIQAKYDVAIDMGKTILKELGVELPDEQILEEATRHEVEKVKVSLGHRPLHDIIELPLIDDANTKALVKILIILEAPTYFINFSLFKFVVAKAINIGLKEGHLPESPHAYGNFGLILCILGDFHQGFEFGLLGLLLSEKLNAYRCIAHNTMGLSINHWTKHVKSSVDIARKGIQFGLEEGEIQFVCYNHFGLLNALVSQGLALDKLVEEVDRSIRFVRINKNTMSECCFLSIRQFALNLQGKTIDKYSFDEGAYSETEFIETSKALMMSMAYFHVYKLQSYYLFENYEDALKMSVKAQETINQVGTFLTMVNYNFFYSLTLSALLTNASEKESGKYWEALKANQNQLKSWSNHCPDNFLNMYLLVEAEINRIMSNDQAAMDLYEQSIASAHEEGFIQNEAIANELAAKWLMRKGQDEFAKAHMVKARALYLRWGASRKVVDLESKYTEYLPRLQESSAGDYMRVAGIDIHSVLKSSQAISSIIDLRSLLSKVMGIMIENAGARQGSVILEEDGALKVVVSIEGLNEIAKIGQSVPLESASNVSQAIVNYVMRTRDALVLDDAASDERFNADQYIKQTKPRSILSIPIVRKGKLLGAIYLENNLATGAFSKERLQVVGLLASQVGISIENARLFEEARAYAERLAEEVAHRKRVDERLQIATHAAKIGIWDWDVTKNELVWDDSMYAIYGIRPGDFSVAYEAWSHTILPEDKARTEGQVQAALRGECEYAQEFRITWPDGSIHHIKADSQTFRNSDGKALRMVGTNIDVTEQRKLEEQVRQFQKMEAVGQLAGGVAHDFNNILAGIMGCAELLSLKVGGDEESKEYVDTIIQVALQASELTGKLLSFSRKSGAARTLFNIHESISRTVGMLEHTIDRRIDIKKDLAAGRSMINGDQSALQNVLLNLGINSRDAMPEGGTLTFRTRNFSVDHENQNTESTLKPGQYIEITVEDSGIGMSAETLGRAFEPFFTTKGLGKGTGLGLSVVYNSVKTHQGAIDVSSQINKGTKIRISLPLALTDQCSVADAEEETQLVRGSGCLLVVDDDVVVRMVSGGMLRELGYEVLFAADGEEGVKLYRENRDKIALVILDIVMPKMNGRDAFYALKEINPAVKVLISSGFAQDTSVDKLIEDGVLGFMNKPYRKRELARILAETLS